MPHIPIPPSPTMTTQQILQKLQTINTMSPQNNVVQKITDLAREQAKIALDELLKQEQEKRKQTILTIENIDKIRGHKYSEWLEVGGVTESDFYYEFTLLDEKGSQVETILLHRRQTSDKRYIMEYNNHTLWVTKDRLDTIDAIIECMKEI
jgi:hypothetical protein